MIVAAGGFSWKNMMTESLELLKLYLLYAGILGFPLCRERKRRLLGIGAMAAVLVCSSSVQIYVHWGNSGTVLYFGLVLLLFEGKGWRKAGWYLPMVSLGETLWLLTFGWACVLRGKSVIAVLNGWSGSDFFWMHGDLLLLLALVWMVEKGRRAGNRAEGCGRIEALLDGRELLVLNLICVGLYLFQEGSIGVLLRYYDRYKTENLLLIGAGLTGASLLGCLILLLLLQRSRETYKRMALTHEALLHTQEAYYELAEEKNQKLRDFRHDFQRHVECLHGLAVEGKTEEIRQYTERLMEIRQEVRQQFATGNSIVDAVLTELAAEAEESGARILCTGKIPQELMLDSVELCALFSNGLKNAVEACARCTDRETAWESGTRCADREAAWESGAQCADRENAQESGAQGNPAAPATQKLIQIDLLNQGSSFYLLMKNPMAEGEDGEKTFGISRKQGAHGLGMEHMRRIVEKHGGQIRWTAADGQVELFLRLPMTAAAGREKEVRNGEEHESRNLR